MALETLYHGGESSNENFCGETFWTRKLGQAQEYADNIDKSDIYVIEIDLDNEIVEDGDDFLPEWFDSENCTNDEDWQAQTEACRSAIAAGATVVGWDDGLLIVNVSRLNPRLITDADVEEFEENFYR